MTCRTFLGSVNALNPATYNVPAVGRNKVATALMKVVLPAPLGPNNAVIWPDWATRSSPCQTVNGYSFRTLPLTSLPTTASGRWPRFSVSTCLDLGHVELGCG